MSAYWAGVGTLSVAGDLVFRVVSSPDLAVSKMLDHPTNPDSDNGMMGTRSLYVAREVDWILS